MWRNVIDFIYSDIFYLKHWKNNEIVTDIQQMFTDIEIDLKIKAFTDTSLEGLLLPHQQQPWPYNYCSQYLKLWAIMIYTFEKSSLLQKLFLNLQGL